MQWSAYTKTKWWPHAKLGSFFNRGAKECWEDDRFPLHSTPSLAYIHITLFIIHTISKTHSLRTLLLTTKSTLIKKDDLKVWLIILSSPCSEPLVSIEASEVLMLQQAVKLAYSIIAVETKHDEYSENNHGYCSQTHILSCSQGLQRFLIQAIGSVNITALTLPSVKIIHVHCSS